MPETRKMEAKCLCGKSHFSAEVPLSSLPLPRLLCHCTSCRRGTGMLFYSAVTWPGSSPDTSTLVKYASSPNQDTYHCATCGSHMFWHRHSNFAPDDSPLFCVTPGVLVDPADLTTPTYHQCVADTHDGGLSVWLPSVSGRTIPRWSGLPSISRQLSPTPTSSTSSPTTSSTTLHARCLCGGVAFNIHPPLAWQLTASPPIWSIDAASRRYRASLCTCTSCRLDAGCDAVPWMFPFLANISRDAAGTEPLRFAGDGELRFDDPAGSTLREYASSPGTKRYHCGTCGATMFYWHASRPDNLDVAVGLVEAGGDEVGLKGEGQGEGARLESWLCWDAEVSYPEDIVDPVFIGALREGLRGWVKDAQR